LVTPAPRVLLVIGRSFSAAIRALSQAFIIYLLSFFLGIHVRFDPLALLGMVMFVILGAVGFSTFSLVVASIVKKRERFMGIGQVLTMPLFFASNALYPIELMPSWMQKLSSVNPLTYQVDALRSLMIVGTASQFGLLCDFAVGIGTFAVFVVIATKLYPKILY
jgi:ABC-2 type transport system permease protein